MKNRLLAAPLILLGLAVSVSAKVSFEDALKAYDKKGGSSEAHKGDGEDTAGHGKTKKAVHSEAHAATAPHGAKGGDPWQRLVAGNKRHKAGNWQHPDLSVKRRKELGAGQKPFAAVLACADSRVAPELVFDQGLGDLFVVRVAGNVAGAFDRASIEYGVEHLHIGLLVVLGHERCGAVKASLETMAKPGSEAGLSPDLKALVMEIAPAVKGKSGDEGLDEGVSENARLSAQRLLAQSEILRKAVKEGHLKLVIARYDLDSGAVEKLD